MIGPAADPGGLQSRAAARERRARSALASDIRHARISAGLSQDEVGRRAGVSGDKVWRLEHERLEPLSIIDVFLIAAVVGLDLSVRAFPTGAPIRDAGQAPRLLELLRHVGVPLRYQTDAALPRKADGLELRAWDALVLGSGERTGIEPESRVTDFQATTRRHNLKRADDRVDHFLLVIADTRHNRRVMRDFAPLLGDLRQLRTANVLRLLQAGRHPPTGWIFL